MKAIRPWPWKRCELCRSSTRAARSSCRVRTTLGNAYDYPESGRVHALMERGELPDGNVAVLINAPERGLTGLP